MTQRPDRTDPTTAGRRSASAPQPISAGLKKLAESIEEAEPEIQERKAPKATFVFRWQKQVAKGPTMSRGAYRLAIVMSQQLDNDLTCRRAHGWFEKSLSVSRTYIQNALTDLQSSGHIEIESRRGQGITNRYRPVLMAETEAAPLEAEAAAATDLGPPKLKTPAAPEPEMDVRDLQAAISAAGPDGIALPPTEIVYSVEGLFDQFWRCFAWRPGEHEREQACREFEQIVRSGVDPSVIISGARRFAQMKRLSGADDFEGQINATLWLRSKRWISAAVVA